MRAKKVLLLNPPGKRLYLRDCYCSTTSKTNYYWQPLDLLIQSGILNRDFDVRVLDANAQRLKEEEAQRQISDMNLDAILLLMGSISWKEDLSFIKELRRRNPLAKFIASGDLLRFNSAKMMEELPFIDAILLDFTSGALLNFLADRARGRKIENLIYRFKGEIITGDISKETDFEIPIPRHELFSLNSYRLPFGERKPFASLLTTYGCPYRCKFCNVGTEGFKRRKVENLIEELTYIVSKGIAKIYVRDPTFGADREHAKRVCQGIIAGNFRIGWNCFSRVDAIDEDLLRLMKEAGCYLIQFGVESGDEGILRRYDKGIDLESIKKAFRLCKEYKIEAGAHFILGLPGEDRTSILETLTLAKSLDCAYAAFNIATPRFGSPFRDECREKKWIVPDEYTVDNSCDFPAIETETLSREELWRLRNMVIRGFYFRPRYLTGRLLAIRGLDDFRTLFENGLSLLRNLKE